MRRYAEPMHELARDESAPAADVGLVRGSDAPDIVRYGLLGHVRSRKAPPLGAPRARTIQPTRGPFAVPDV
jgi:hypothetical protein